MKIGHPRDYFIHTNIIIFIFKHLLQQRSQLLLKFQGRRSGPKGGGGGGEAGVGVGVNGGEGRCVWQRVPQLIVKSTPVNGKSDRLSAICTSRAKMSASRTRPDKTTLLVTTGDNFRYFRHFRTLRAITYKMILNKSNALLAACLHLLATFAFACKKKIQFAKKVGGGGKVGGGKRPPCPSPSAAYEFLLTLVSQTYWQVVINTGT